MIHERDLRIGCTAIALLMALGLVGSASAETRSYSPYAGEDFPRELYWGDTHVHTSWSADAGNSGNRQIDPATAYRFARGEEVTAHNGMRVRLRRPLDFLLVSDHAEYLGVMAMLDEEDPLLMKTETGRRWADWRKSGDDASVFGEFARSLLENRDVFDDHELESAVWARVIQNAERFNEPGRFTAFIGYEWTSSPDGNNLHRNILFRDGPARTSQIVPFSSFDGDTPEKLWVFLEQYESRTGGGVLSIPHNPNLSGGLMFALSDSNGRPIDSDYARVRARWEPILEITQYKGDSETHPALSPADEFADYETWAWSNIGGTPHQDAWLEFEYARAALKNGLAMAGSVAANPFRYGFIGSSDAHTGLAAAEEDNFWGKMTKSEPSPERWRNRMLPPEVSTVTNPFEWQMAASGYAAVWARENTREALFEAMRRRETYATTGPRITLRFFGGFEFDRPDAEHPDLARVGYAKGVPMGGELGEADRQGDSDAPSFLVAALRDPEGANLDRIQIVKGWVDSTGEKHERVYDVAVSEGRKIGRKGRVKKPVGSTVDVEQASWTNTIGAALLKAWWRDPDFDPSERAFYYARVIEIPKPRWTAYDRRFFGIEMLEEVPMTTQDRAYSSPIWYTP